MYQPPARNVLLLLCVGGGRVSVMPWEACPALCFLAANASLPRAEDHDSRAKLLPR